MARQLAAASLNRPFEDLDHQPESPLDDEVGSLALWFLVCRGRIPRCMLAIRFVSGKRGNRFCRRWACFLGFRTCFSCRLFLALVDPAW